MSRYSRGVHAVCPCRRPYVHVGHGCAGSECVPPCVFPAGQAPAGDGDGAAAADPLQGDGEQGRGGGGDQAVLQ